MTNTQRLCKNCDAFDAKAQECHKRAPHPVNLNDQKKERWPNVQPINWCMEFVPKPQ